MSHFSVVVALDSPDDLADAFAPFDENQTIGPYRSYEAGEASQHWLYRSLKDADEHHRNGTGILPYRQEGTGLSSSSSTDTPEVQRQKIAHDAELFRSLPDPVTWADIVRIYNERYGDSSEQMLFDEAIGRAYMMSTYNPESKWDWYAIGGRWHGYFLARPDADQVELIRGEPALLGRRSVNPQECDGGRKRALDLEGMRNAKADEARMTYARWSKAIEGTPEARPWRAFAERVGDDYPIEQARADYHAQPRVAAIKGTDLDSFTECAIETYQKPEVRYVETAWAQAVPGYALLTLDGTWLAPGRMGWFGMSSDNETDRIGYWSVANSYIDALPDSTWLIAVDCHI